MSWFIYGLRTGTSSEYRYVGLTRQPLSERLYQHRSLSRTKRTPLYNWLAKHIDNVVIESIEDCPEEDFEYLAEAEQFWIVQIRSFGHRLLNLAEGGASGSYGARWTLKPEQVRSGAAHPKYGKKLSPEHAEALRLTRVGHTRSEESRRKQGDSIRGEKHHAYGKPMTDEQKRKISDALRGRKLSNEHRQRMSEARQGISLSDIHKQNIGNAIRGENHHNYGKPAHNRGQPSSSAHTRWHVNKGISKPETCQYCAL
jgi:hypothetical protein